MRVVNTDAKSYLTNTLERCLQDAAKAKKKMYLEACLQQRQHFLPLVTSVDVLLDTKVGDTLKRIASHLTTKW